MVVAEKERKQKVKKWWWARKRFSERVRRGEWTN
jgi:hypothetical protein